MGIFSQYFCITIFIHIFAAESFGKVQIAKRNIFNLMLLVVVMFNLTSTTLFLHRHQIDERIIVHSHPFSGSPESHSHSTSSLDIIARQAISEALAITTFTIEQCDDFVEFVAAIPSSYNAISQSVSGESLRAPPVA